MPGCGSRCLLCTIVMMLACTSAADARHWRYYGYHWYGHTWSDSHRGNDESRGDEGARGAGNKTDLSNQVGDFGSAIERMIRACDQQASELKKMPLDDVTQTVKPTESQHKALEQIQSVALDTAETLGATCPKALPKGLNGQLAILSHTLEAMATSLRALRPTFATFYGLLDDEQKARLVAMGVSNNSRARSEQDGRATGRQNIDRRGGSNQGSFCQQWVIDLRSWPVRQIEDGASLSDEQRATLYELTAAIYRAAGRLGASCNADDRFTPPGRLEARQVQLEALQQGIDAIRPVFSRFESELTDVQKARLGSVVNVSTEVTSAVH